MRSRHLHLLIAAALVIVTAGTVRATDITTCGTTIAPGDTGVLQADLDCTYPFGVRLLRRTTLDLNGHRISMDGAGTAVLGVARILDEDILEGGRGNFTIRGPGEISGVVVDPNHIVGTYACVAVQDGRALITSATGVVDIHDCFFGVAGYIPEYATTRANVTLENVVLHDIQFEGIAVRKLTASNVTAYDNHAFGLYARWNMRATDIVAYNNPIGLFAGRNLRGSNITATGNTIGLESFRRIDATDVVSTGNERFGVTAQRVRLTNSTATGNGLSDIQSDKPPQLVNTTCDVSQRGTTTESWGVCAND